LVRNRTIRVIAEKLAPKIIDLVLLTDAMSIPILSFLLNLQMRRWLHNGSFKNYRLRLRRIQKSYYELNLLVIFNAAQTEELLVRILGQAWELLKKRRN